VCTNNIKQNETSKVVDIRNDENYKVFSEVTIVKLKDVSKSDSTSEDTKNDTPSMSANCVDLWKMQKKL